MVMGRLNILRGKATDALIALSNIKKRTDPKDADQNKRDYDAQFKRLKTVQAKVKSFGMETSIYKVTLRGQGHIFYTGLENETEVKDLLTAHNLNHISIVQIEPGTIYH
jgi:hypothetical protein